jgi:hypothetical protein
VKIVKELEVFHYDTGLSRAVMKDHKLWGISSSSTPEAGLYCLQKLEWLLCKHRKIGISMYLLLAFCNISTWYTVLKLLMKSNETVVLLCALSKNVWSIICTATVYVCHENIWWMANEHPSCKTNCAINDKTEIPLSMLYGITASPYRSS